MKNWKTSGKIIGGLLVSGVLLGASAYALPPISADYKLQGEVKKALLADPDIVDAVVHIHNDGKVYLDYEDTYVNQTAYTCNEDMERRENEIWALVSETAGVDGRDVHRFIQGTYELKTAIKDREVFLDEISEIKPFHQYDLSPQDWDYLMERVEKGDLGFGELSEESQHFWDVFYQLERTPLSSAIMSSNIGEPTTAQKTTVYQVFNEIGSGSVTYSMYYDEQGEVACQTYFDHLYSDGFVMSYDFCETWEIVEELTLVEVAQP